MSIVRTLNTGAAGLRAHNDALGVTGDNIANVNTVGYKNARAGFQDMLGRSIAGAGNLNRTPGAGSYMGYIEHLWTQGALMTTESPTDLAISGDGLFVVEGNVSGIDGQYYTRAGQFHIDVNGKLVDPHGMKLQGYAALPDGTISAELGDLTVAGQTIAAQPTGEVDVAVQLSSEEPIPPAWDPTDPAATSNFSTNVTVYDSLGNAHELTTYFRHSGSNTWEWHAMVDGADLTGGTAGVPTEGASGTLQFTTNGELSAETMSASSWDFLNATAGQSIDFDFGTSLAEGGTGLDGSTQFAEVSATTGLAQDGYRAGTVAGISIDNDGTIQGVFSNGERRVLGQVAIADFASVDGLSRAGQGLWTATEASGEALLGAAGSGGRGAIVAGALEGSNVDLSREFVNLISYQRGFQANSRIVTTAEEVYQELVNMKR